MAPFWPIAAGAASGVCRPTIGGGMDGVCRPLASSGGDVDRDDYSRAVEFFDRYRQFSGCIAKEAELDRLIIILDCSKSMNIRDAGPDGKETRATRARNVILISIKKSGASLRQQYLPSAIAQYRLFMTPSVGMLSKASFERQAIAMHLIKRIPASNRPSRQHSSVQEIGLKAPPRFS